MKIDELGFVFDPNFGDSEVHRIDFQFPNLEIHLKIHDGLSRVIRLMNVSYFYAETDHLQNVIDSIYIIYPSEISRFYDRSEYLKRIPISVTESNSKYIIFTVPISGGSFFCLFDRFELLEGG